MHETEGNEDATGAAADNSFMISVHNPNHVDELINLAGAMRPKRAVGEMVAVNVIDNRGNDEVQQKRSKRMLDRAVQTASAADMVLNTCLRYDVNFINGIVGAMREYRTTDLILGVDKNLYLSKSSLGNVLKGTNENNPVDLTTHTLAAYDDMLIVAKEMQSNDALVFVMSRRHNPSYNAAMEKVPAYIDTYFSGSNFILLFPMQERNMLYL